MASVDVAAARCTLLYCPSSVRRGWQSVLLSSLSQAIAEVNENGSLRSYRPSAPTQNVTFMRTRALSHV